MKAVIVFLLVVLGGFGFIQLMDWLVEEPPPHVFHVRVAKPDKQP
jgi:hypothetical protein